jgi:hypothetical protein
MVDLSTPVNEMLAVYATNKKLGEYLFATRKGTPFTSRGLHKQALTPLGIPGFHSMRRWRVSYLKKFGTPEQLLKFWIGHSGNDTTARDDKSCDDREWRQTWANRCGIGFALPEIVKAGHPASNSSKVFEPVASSSPQPAAAPKVSEALQPQPTYIAQDNDLDSFFYSAPEEAA